MPEEKRRTQLARAWRGRYRAAAANRARGCPREPGAWLDRRAPWRLGLAERQRRLQWHRRGDRALP